MGNAAGLFDSMEPRIAKLAMVVAVAMLAPGAAWALPSLQLGPGDDASWTYVGGGDDTWYVGDTAFTLGAYANALKEDGGNGDYAFTDDNTSKTAYLVFSAVPKIDSPDGEFDLTVMDEHGALTLVQEGFGSPPDAGGTDNDDLASHGIYDTYFYIYEFDFDGALTDIEDQQPGGTGTGKGYAEMFTATVNNTGAAVDGIHMDLFTVGGDGKLVTTDADGNPLGAGDLVNQINTFAPFSHDAQFGGTPPLQVPEPGTLVLLLGAVFGPGLTRRARR